MVSLQLISPSQARPEATLLHETNIGAPTGFLSLTVRVAVLDDDEVFLKVVERYARQVGIVVETFANVPALAEAISSRPYDVAIVDYYLDNDIGSDVAESMPDLPVLLVSRKSDWVRNNPTLPSWIKGFVHKKYGAKAVLQEALALALKTRHGGA